jgi:hypothetical protein
MLANGAARWLRRPIRMLGVVAIDKGVLKLSQSVDNRRLQ